MVCAHNNCWCQTVCGHDAATQQSSSVLSSSVSEEDWNQTCTCTVWKHNSFSFVFCSFLPSIICCVHITMSCVNSRLVPNEAGTNVRAQISTCWTKVCSWSYTDLSLNMTLDHQCNPWWRNWHFCTYLRQINSILIKDFVVSFQTGTRITTSTIFWLIQPGVLFVLVLCTTGDWFLRFHFSSEATATVATFQWLQVQHVCSSWCHIYATIISCTLMLKLELLIIGSKRIKIKNR